MKAKKENKENKESATELSEQDSQQLKQALHSGMASSITFAEVMQLVNNALIQETEQRFNNMSAEEALRVLSEVKDSVKSSEEEE